MCKRGIQTEVSQLRSNRFSNEIPPLTYYLIILHRTGDPNLELDTTLYLVFCNKLVFYFYFTDLSVIEYRLDCLPRQLLSCSDFFSSSKFDIFKGRLTYRVSVSHWWKVFACLANSLRSLSFSSCRAASFVNSTSRSAVKQWQS